MSEKALHQALVILGTVMWTVVSACSADTEAPGQGTCSLKCSTPKAAASNFTVRLLNNVSAIDSKCLFSDGQAATAPQNGPVQLRFQVVETVEPFSTVLGSSNPSGASGALLKEVPRAGIGFEPFVYGQAAVEKSAQGYNPADKSVTPFKYAGVVTPASEWCTDTCGVATVEVWPLCIKGTSNSVKVGIFMQGVPSIPTVDIVTQ